MRQQALIEHVANFQMLNEAGMTMTNKQDAEIIKSLGQQYVDTVNRLTGD